MHRYADGQRILRDVDAVVATDRWNSFDRFHETTRTLVQGYEAAGARAEVYAIQTGGGADTGRWIIQEAEDVLQARVDLVAPVRQRLLDYADNPWHVIQWSGSTPREGLTCNLVVVDTIEELERIPRGALTGKMILTRMTPRGLLRNIEATGAAGVLTDFPQPGLPEATAWIKFGWGQVPRSEDPARLPGLVLSEARGRQLRALIQEHGAATVHATVEVRRYVGRHDLVSGLILGRDDPQDEVWALAHSAEPGAVDNASGVAVCLEIARLLEGLIAEGRMPRPRRTIRLLNAYECYGFFHYMEHVRRLQTPLAGVCLDTLGTRPDVCDGRLSWRATIPMSAGFVDRVGEGMLRAALALGHPGYTLHTGPFVSTADTLAGDPKYGFPCPWLTTHYLNEGVYRAYHSSADTRDLLSPEGLAVCAAAMAGYLYYLADAGSSEVMELAAAETDRMAAILEKGVKEAASELWPGAGQTAGRAAEPLSSEETAYLREAHHASIERLKRWLWGGDRSGMLAHLAACEARVRDAAGKGAGRRTAPFAPGASLVPYRTAFLTPSLANAPQAIADRIGKAGLPDWAMFWADGRRTIGEIAAALSCEHQRPAAVEKVAAYFEGLADLGYVRLIDPDDMITKERLVRDLHLMGLSAGMDVMVHSALSRIGYVRGGADTVVDALLEAIGPEGTLLMPSFNHRAARVFNPMTTPTTNGAIPDAMWRRPEAARSLHPTHAVAAIGPKAAWYVDGHLEAGIWAPDSPIGRLVHGGGYLLSLGVTHDATTAYHVAELSVPCGCIDPSGNTDRIVAPDGAVQEAAGLAFRAGECPVPPVRLHDTLRAAGLERAGRVGEADCSFVRAIDLWHARREHLKDACPACTIRPRYLKGERGK
jgi:aminoglycoside N3'-acetyltransferase